MKRRHSLSLLAAAVVLGLVTGCITRPPPAPPSYAVLLDNPDGTTGAISVNGPRGQILVNRSHYGATLDGSGVACLFDPSQFESDFAAVLAARPQLPVSFTVNFPDGDLTPAAGYETVLTEILTAVKSRPVPEVSIVGHTDTVGAPEDNEKLGLERAHLVAKLLTAAGLRVRNVTVESHGEFNLKIKTPDDTPEPRNHRVDISVR